MGQPIDIFMSQLLSSCRQEGDKNEIDCFETQRLNIFLDNAAGHLSCHLPDSSMPSLTDHSYVTDSGHSDLQAIGREDPSQPDHARRRPCNDVEVVCAGSRWESFPSNQHFKGLSRQLDGGEPVPVIPRFAAPKVPLRKASFGDLDSCLEHITTTPAKMQQTKETVTPFCSRFNPSQLRSMTILTRQSSFQMWSTSLYCNVTLKQD